MLLIFFLKLLEEKELAERFGEAYLKYKQEFPSSSETSQAALNETVSSAFSKL